jgi:hypothetical protein
MTKLTWSELTLPPINLWSLPNNRVTFVKTKTEDLVEAQRLGDDRAAVCLKILSIKLRKYDEFMY